MYAQKLKEVFDVYYKAPVYAWEEFSNHCEKVFYKKEEVIKRANQKEKHLFFLLSGSAGIFLWKKNNFVCLDFSFENTFFCDYLSLLTNEATPLETIAMENTEMLRLARKDFFELGKYPLGQTILRIAAESSFIEKQEQQINLLTKTASERYVLLTKKYPGISKRIPKKHIASFLGITPQSLSRLEKVMDLP